MVSFYFSLSLGDCLYILFFLASPPPRPYLGTLHIRCCFLDIAFVEDGKGLVVVQPES